MRMALCRRCGLNGRVAFLFAIFFGVHLREMLHGKRSHRRDDRHAQKHAQKAEQRPAGDHGHEHPDARQAHRLPHHVRIDKVPLDLLEDHQKHDELQGLHGVLRQDHRSAHDAADPRAGERDERRHAHDKADGGSVGELQDGAADGAQGAQDDGLDALPADEAREAVVGDGARVQHAAAQVLAGDEAGRAHSAGVHAVLVKQQVQREHHAQQDRKRQMRHLAAGLRHDAQRLIGSAHGI